MFIGGDSDEAKAAVTALLKATGWDVVDLGGIEASRYLEPICITWVRYGARAGTWDHAFSAAPALSQLASHAVAVVPRS